MRKILSLLALCLGFVVAASAAHARVNISIDLSSQTMRVSSPSGGSHTWAISSARSGYVTPRGSYSPTSLQRMHYSKKYHNSPMPHSIFFRGGYAIHGTGAVSQLGRPASHGCIRLAPGNAARLFQMVKAEGASIHISGSPPASRNVQYAKAKKAKSTLYAAKASKKVQYAARRAPAQNYYGYAPQQRRVIAPVRAWQQDPAGSSWRW
jgi:hypothetical protein